MAFVIILLVCPRKLANFIYLLRGPYKPNSLKKTFGRPIERESRMIAADSVSHFVERLALNETAHFCPFLARNRTIKMLGRIPR
jgi:hypothetical protein